MGRPDQFSHHFGELSLVDSDGLRKGFRYQFGVPSRNEHVTHSRERRRCCDVDLDVSGTAIANMAPTPSAIEPVVRILWFMSFLAP